MPATIKDLGLDRLSSPERLELAEELLESIVEEPITVSVPDWHLEILRERLVAATNDTTPDVSWEEFRAELLGRGRKP